MELKCERDALSCDVNFSPFSLAKSPPPDRQITTTNNGLLTRNGLQLRLAANNILLMLK